MQCGDQKGFHTGPPPAAAHSCYLSGAEILKDAGTFCIHHLHRPHEEGPLIYYPTHRDIPGRRAKDVILTVVLEAVDDATWGPTVFPGTPEIVYQ